MSKIEVDKNKTIELINAQFNSVYPFLRIGFFKEGHKKGQVSKRSKMIVENLKLSEIMQRNVSDTIAFNDKTSVWDFEKDFENRFGLHIQIFRKSGNIWLETSATDKWSLEQQNEQGKFLDEDLKFEKENPDEHDMY